MKVEQKSWKGKDLWENIQTWSCIALLIVTLILTNYRTTDSEGNYTSLITPGTTGLLFQGLIYYVLIYTIGYFAALYYHAKKNSGKTILKGHLDQGLKMGEDFEFRVKKFKKAERITGEDAKEIAKLLKQAKLDGSLIKRSNSKKIKKILGEKDEGKNK